MNDEVRQRCVGVLRHVLAQEKGETRVCAAEFLLTLDYRDGVVEAFAAELPKADTQPGARIGVWRVMARAATDDKRRAVWIAKIREVFLDTAAPDRVAAIEALAELGYQVRPAGDAQLTHEALQDQGPLAVYARWVLAANLISVPVSYVLMRGWLRDFPYRITLGWGIFAGAVAATLIIAQLTVIGQAVRAARTNPADVLRNE